MNECNPGIVIVVEIFENAGVEDKNGKHIIILFQSMIEGRVVVKS
jgi:hypothetical protein